MKITGAVALLFGASLAAAEPSAVPAASESVNATPVAVPADRAADRLQITFSPQPRTAPLPVDASPVIVLPNFDVRDSRIDLEEHRLLTAKGLLAEAKRRELSPMYQRTFGPLAVVAAVYFNPLSLLMGVRANDAEAMVLFAQDERLRRLHESESLIEVYKESDPATYQDLKVVLRESFQLRSPTAAEH